MKGDDTRRVAVLAYHKIGPAPGGWETWNYVPEDIFEAQLHAVRRAGWEWIDVATFRAGLQSPARLPRRAALLTFDDGYRSMRSVALPILARFEAPAVLFVPTAFVGGTNAFDEGIEPEEPMCDWDDLRALASAGVSIQSHSVHHPRFSELPNADQADEFGRSKLRLEEELGHEVDLFGFPYGDAGEVPAETATLLASAGYRAAFLYGGGVLEPAEASPFQLPRLAIGPDSDVEALLET